MKKDIKIERITCNCGGVIAGCVHGQQDARWDADKRKYMRDGCAVDIVDVESFKFVKCNCPDQPTKKRFKVLSEETAPLLLF